MNRTRVTGLCVAAAMVLVASVGRAQLNEEGDWQFWTQDAATVAINEKTSLMGDVMLRYGDDMSDLWYRHGDIALVRKINSKLSLKLSYRYKECETGPPAIHKWRGIHNPSANAILSTKMGDWKLKNVCRFTYWDFDHDFRELRGMRINTDRWFYRNILAVVPPVSVTDLKLTPFLKEDFFVDLKEGEINRNRVSVGVVMGKYKAVKPSLYYMWEASDWKQGGWRHYNIVGLDFSIRF